MRRAPPSLLAGPLPHQAASEPTNAPPRPSPPPRPLWGPCPGSPGLAKPLPHKAASGPTSAPPGPSPPPRPLWGPCPGRLGPQDCQSPSASAPSPVRRRGCPGRQCRGTSPGVPRLLGAHPAEAGCPRGRVGPPVRRPGASSSRDQRLAHRYCVPRLLSLPGLGRANLLAYPGVSRLGHRLRHAPCGLRAPGVLDPRVAKIPRHRQSQVLDAQHFPERPDHR